MPRETGWYEVESRAGVERLFATSHEEARRRAKGVANDRMEPVYLRGAELDEIVCYN